MKSMHIYMNNFFILTGAPGSGKSTILQRLSQLNFTVIDEPARQILAEQRSVDGHGVSEKDTKLFTELMLSRAIFQYQQMQDHQLPVIFDRGIPDLIGYAKLFGFDLKHAHNAANKYRYNNNVFVLPNWQEIYATDDERTISFAEASAFGDSLREIYLDLGYNIIDVPIGPAEERAHFLQTSIANVVKQTL